MFVLMYGYLDICVYTLKTQSLILHEYFCNLHKWYFAKSFIWFLTFFIQHYASEPYAVYVYWNIAIHCMDYIVFTHSLSAFVAFISLQL